MATIVNGTTGVEVPGTGYVQLDGSSSGNVKIQAPAVAGTNTLTAPASTGTISTTSYAVAMSIVFGG